MASRRLPINLNLRLNHAQHEYLEYLGHHLDLTMSGAIRHLIDASMNEPSGEPGGAEGPSWLDRRADDAQELDELNADAAKANRRAAK